MMWKIVFALAISLGGSLAFLNPSCEPQKCGNPLPPEMERNVYAIMSAEALKESCPGILEFIECVKAELRSCTDMDFEGLMTSDDKDTAAFGTILLGSSKLVTDLCNEDTQIHKAFVGNVDCIKRALMSEENYQCGKEASSLYLAYSEGLSTESNPKCLVSAYILACISGEVQKECGEEARRTVVDIVKRTKILQAKVCSPEDLLELKTDFKEHLQLEGERQSIFEQAFDLRKKK